MQIIVTGAAGFIGGHLCHALLRDGHAVSGVDSLTDYYDVSLKRRVVQSLRGYENFTWLEGDMNSMDLTSLVRGVDVVYHLAAQPGVRLSWSEHFATYLRDNVLASQRLLEAVRSSPGAVVVAASSASVYGNTTNFPTDEDVPPRPYNPYGVTKLAMEHLFRSYAENFSVPSVLLRYFSVYGPGQRPDMGLFRFIEAALTGRQVQVFGDGSQQRDFTYVSDVVEATILASKANLEPGTTLNVAASAPASVQNVLDLVGNATGQAVPIQQLPEQPGDVQITGGSTARIEALLGWHSRVSLAEGVELQVLWQRASQSPIDK